MLPGLVSIEMGLSAPAAVSATVYWGTNMSTWAVLTVEVATWVKETHVSKL